jgi:hypothetical protein
MLKLSTKDVHKTSDNKIWEIFQSEEDENIFYVAPLPQLAKEPTTGDFLFSLVEYAGENAGGYCTMQTQLDIPAQDMAEIQQYLKKVYSHLTPHPQSLTGQFNLQAFLTYASTDGRISSSVEAKPSTSEGNLASFLITLTPEALNFFKSYFGGDVNAGFVNIRYEFNAPGRLPLIKVDSTFNASVAYEYEKIHTVSYDKS